VAQAQTFAFVHQQAIADWLEDAVWSLAVKRRGKAHAKRAYEAAIRFMRFEAVRIANKLGLTWDESYAQASEVLAAKARRYFMMLRRS
jgi:hypothetical protein